MKKGLETGLVYAGAIIGAGFATGAELCAFFACFGYMGFYGITLALFLFIILGFLIFSLTACSPSQTPSNAFGGGIISKTAATLNTVFVFTLLVSMTAASASLSKELLNIPPFAGGLLFCAAMYFCSADNSDVFANTGAFLTALLAICGIYTGLCLCPPFALAPVFNAALLPKVSFSALMYVSYNILCLFTVMFPFKNRLKCVKIRITAALTGSFAMFILGICLLPPLVLYYNKCGKSSLPLACLAEHKLNGFVFGIYAVAVFAAVLTTGAGCLYGLTHTKGKFCQILLLCGAYVCSFLGFNKIISKIYPVFGILGLLNIALIVYNYIMLINNSVKRKIYGRNGRK